MAGGKESPRQKMIGMMYLVLTALLALNVSNAVLEKFAVLNTTLEELREEAAGVNTETLRKVLESTSTKPAVVEAKKNAQQVRDLTDKLIKDLEGYKVKLSQNHSNEDIPKHELILNTNIAEEKMLNSSLNPEFGKNFEKILVEYQSSVASVTGLKDLPKLNKRASDYKEFKDNDHHNKKDFLHFQFEGTPTMAAITTITQLQNEALEVETMALEEMAKLADAEITKVDIMVPMVKAKSNIVAAGDRYVGDLFMAASSSGLSPEMYRNGAKLTVQDDPESKMKFGKIEFPVSATNYDAQGLSKQSFKAKVVVKDKVYEKDFEYFVAKPTVKVTTGVAPTLFMNCGNPVIIEVPSLGTNYQPTFQGKGATIIKTSKVTDVIIVPTENKPVVTVINAGLALEPVNFLVKEIPKPHIVMMDQSNRPIDELKGVKIAGLNSVSIMVEAEKGFAEFAPKDKNYRIRSMDVMLQRNGTNIKIKNVTSETAELGDFKADMRAGDLLVFVVKAVVRKTYLGQDEKLDFYAVPKILISN